MYLKGYGIKYCVAYVNQKKIERKFPKDTPEVFDLNNCSKNANMWNHFKSVK